MVYRGIALCMFAVLALLGGCDTDTLAVDKGNLDHYLDQVVSLQVFPVRREYALEGDAIAKTEDHLSVFAVYSNGSTRAAPLRDTKVTLEEEEPVILTEDEPHPFTSSGEKVVTVTYGAGNARYTIIVRSGDVPGLTPGPSSDDGTTIVFEPQW